MNDKVSVIVPIYNVEQYLRRCVDSILNQTHDNLEVILIDDGSTDGCPAICDEYKERNKKVKVIHKKNGGLSDARNVGIQTATGAYITCIDSDDFVNRDMISFLYKQLIGSGADIATCGFETFEYVDKLSKMPIVASAKLIDAKDALQQMLYQKLLTNSACAKLYRKRLFDGVRYPVGEICEDLATTYKIFMRAKTIVVSSSAYYYYYQRANSIIHASFSGSRMAGLKFAKKQMQDVVKTYPDMKQAAINRLFAEAFFIALQISRAGTANHDAWLECDKVMRKYAHNITFDSKSKLSYRLLSLFAIFIGANSSALCLRFLSK